MASFKITGGRRLSGELVPQGAKNEALQILCAVLLTKEPVTIYNIPNIRDVNQLIDLLGDMGVWVTKIGEGAYRFVASDVNLDYLDTPAYKSKAAALRGSVMLLGPMLARYKQGRIPRPGGDKIGRRRLDTHFLGFEKLGATFHFDGDFYRVEGEHLKGAYMLLDEASVPVD